ncbi:hypothetical protein [Rhodococcus sp. 14-2470-1a]|uniref:hypothetical protein n=1 Tax=Rhodococcus sp. 14-2470-1a TaxID=2023150 RepID=UPI00211B5056|nr:MULTISPECIES: hypothetical protein [unclassified Rhodococcus (in: high G+C Gram-positive bacteria)]
MKKTMTATVTQTPQRWADAFEQASDQDAEIAAHGRYFTCSYLLDMETHTFVVEMSAGRVHSIAVDPGPLDRPYQFAIRAGVETWQGFGVPVPAPMFHGIWAASFQRDMKLEGDVLTLMQNLRCVTRQIELLRVVGVPV